jgi:hypothetical protein
MRRSILAIAGVVGVTVAGFAIYWRWFPRAGLRWTNEQFNPWLVERGWSGAGRSEIATIEHLGRKTGTRHLTPVHAVPTYDGFRIVVPLAERSQWALNVLATGYCRLQLRGIVYELDEPRLIEPADVRDVQGPVRWMEHRLGFKYLRLHTFASAPGALEPLRVGEPAVAATDRASTATEPVLETQGAAEAVAETQAAPGG